MNNIDDSNCVFNHNLLFANHISRVYEAIKQFDNTKFIVISDGNKLDEQAQQTGVNLKNIAGFVNYDFFSQTSHLFHPQVIYLKHFLSSRPSQQETIQLVRICCQIASKTLIIKDYYYDSDLEFNRLGYKTFASNLNWHRIRLKIEHYVKILTNDRVNSLSIYGSHPIISTIDEQVLPFDAPDNLWLHKNLELVQNIQKNKCIQNIDFLSYRYIYVIANLKHSQSEISSIELDDAQLIRFYNFKPINLQIAQKALVHPPLEISNRLHERELLQQSGIEIEVIEPRQKFQSTSKINLENSQIDTDNAIPEKLAFSDRFTIPNVYLAKIQNALIVPPDYNIMTSDGKPIQESLYLSGQDQLAQSLVSRGKIQTIDTNIDSDRQTNNNLYYYCLANSICSNYYHWNIQCLAATILLKALPASQDICILLPPLKPWQQRSLELAGLKHYQTQPIGTQVREIATLIYPSLLSGNYVFNPWTGIASFFQNIKVAALGQIDFVANQSIYVSRLDNPRRKILNEELLIKKLTEIGFSIILLEQLSLDEQIQVFSQAKIVVAPHGAGLTNIVYCSPGTSVYELFSAHYVNTCYFRLAQIFGVNYWADAFEPVAEIAAHTSEHNISWMVDVERILSRIESIYRSF
jgi:hypothetical protein